MAAVGSADISLFEDFRFDRRGGVLFRRDQQGVLVPLVIGSRAFDILGVLVEHPGVLVTRDEIMNVAWPGTVVEDGNLSVQISALRRVLDDGRSEGSLIQTVPGRGYRFVGQVTQYDPDPLPFMAPSPNGCTDPGRDLPAEPTVLAPPDNMGGPQFGARNGWHLRLGIVVLGLAICLTGVATAIFWTSGFPWFDKAVTSTPRLSVVVMPFANLSD